MISRITALTIGSNYPENIHISPYEEKGKYGFAIYLLRDAELHALLVSSELIFESEKSALEDAEKLCKSCFDVELFGVKARKEDSND